MAPVNLAVACPRLSGTGRLFDKEGLPDGILHASILGDITPLDRYGTGTWDSVMQVNEQRFLPDPGHAALVACQRRCPAAVHPVQRRTQGPCLGSLCTLAATENLAQVLAEELETPPRFASTP